MDVRSIGNLATVLPIQPASRVHNRRLNEYDLAAMSRDLDEIEILHRKLGEKIQQFRADWNQIIIPSEMRR